MKYVVEYSNPNNLDPSRIYTFETKQKSRLNEFLKEARKYSGSYNIRSVAKISEAKNGGKVYLDF